MATVGHVRTRDCRISPPKLLYFLPLTRRGNGTERGANDSHPSAEAGRNGGSGIVDSDAAAWNEVFWLSVRQGIGTRLARLSARRFLSWETVQTES